MKMEVDTCEEQVERSHMTNIFDPHKKYSFPYREDALHYDSPRGVISVVVHKNGTRLDGTPRRIKLMVQTNYGLVPASRLLYSLYHKHWDGQGQIKHLDNDPYNLSKKNLVCVDERVAKNLAHFNNPYYRITDVGLQKLAIATVKLSIAVKERRSSDEL